MCSASKASFLKAPKCTMFMSVKLPGGIPVLSARLQLPRPSLPVFGWIGVVFSSFFVAWILVGRGVLFLKGPGKPCHREMFRLGFLAMSSMVFFGMYPYASSRTELVSVWWDWGGCQEGPVIPNLRERHARFGVPSRSVYEWVGFRNRAPPPCLSPPNTWTVDSGPFRELLSFAKKRRPGTTPCFRLRAVPSNTCWSIKPIAKPSVSGFLGHTKHGTERLV